MDIICSRRLQNSTFKLTPLLLLAPGTQHTICWLTPRRLIEEIPYLQLFVEKTVSLTFIKKNPFYKWVSMLLKMKRNPAVGGMSRAEVQEYYGSKLKDTGDIDTECCLSGLDTLPAPAEKALKLIHRDVTNRSVYTLLNKRYDIHNSKRFKLFKTDILYSFKRLRTWVYLKFSYIITIHHLHTMDISFGRSKGFLWVFYMPEDYRSIWISSLHLRYVCIGSVSNPGQLCRRLSRWLLYMLWILAQYNFLIELSLPQKSLSTR